MLDRLSAELLEASDNKGGAIKKKEEVIVWLRLIKHFPILDFRIWLGKPLNLYRNIGISAHIDAGKQRQLKEFYFTLEYHIR